MILRLLMPFAVVPLLLGCGQSANNPNVDPLAKNVIDDAGLSNLLLSAGDPEQAVTYFSNASAEEPERADLRRGLAISLARAGRYPESARVYQELDGLGQASPADLLEYGYVTVRLQRWPDAEAIDARLPAGLNTPRRHIFAGILADQRKDWETADNAYNQAELLTTNPAKVLNNWGVSKMGRGAFEEAERLFERAVSFDSRLFSAKNNLAIARGLQGNYQLPLVPLSDRERATILNNLGVIAARRNQEDIAKGLFAAAVEAHPQHYQGASDKLAGLEATVEN
ncbi:MAG: tetratricopeptide repeat protein [Pseudomonadota bacterium]